MIRRLVNEDIERVIFLRKEFNEEEDIKNKIISKKKVEEILDDITAGETFGKFINNKLIGMVSLKEYDIVQSLKKTHKENKNRKQIFYDTYNITSQNTILFQNDLIQSKYRGKKYFNELNKVRISRAKEKGYENILMYKSIDSIKGLNFYSDWKIGALIKIRKKQYELLLWRKLND